MTAPSSGQKPLYEPLGPDQIRVLKLEGTCLAGEEGQTPRDLAIKCSLHTVELSDVRSGLIKYGALSYVWGTKRMMRPLSCNGHEKLVTGNLYNALWKFTFHPGSAPDLLWIDAVCIDQEDDSDRSHQVALMGGIYKEADLVIVWLGSGLEVHGEALERTWAMMLERSHDSWTRPPMRLGDQEWFKRMWTLQEIVLARRAEVHMGPFHVDWECFADVGIHHDFEHNPLFKPIQNLRRSKTKPKLSELLEASHRREASDAHDYIYALLGLWTGEGPLRPDYTCGIEEVYENTIQTIFMEHDTIGIGFIHRQVFKDRLAWDNARLSWTAKRNMNWLWHTPNNDDKGIENSSQWTWRRSRPHRFELDRFLKPRVHVTGQPSRLLVSGVILGCCSEIGDSLTWPEDAMDSLGEFRALPDCFTRLPTKMKFDSADTLDACVRATSIVDDDHSSNMFYECLNDHDEEKCSCIPRHEGPDLGLPSELGEHNDKTTDYSPLEYFLCLFFGYPYGLIVSWRYRRPGPETEVVLVAQLGENHHWQVTLFSGLYRNLADPSPNPDLYIDRIPRARDQLNWIPAKFCIAEELPLGQVWGVRQ